MQSSRAEPARPKPPIHWLNLTVLGIPPILAVTLVPWYGIRYGYDAFEWIWFFVLITFCEMSITAGYHRLWSHKAYQAHPVLRFILALGGACALQSDCLTWASDHRRHHRFVDNNEKDPYSANRGFWFSHFGWMIRKYETNKPDLSNVKDLLKDPILVWQRKYYVPLTLFMNIGLPLLIGWYHGDIWGSLLLLGVLRLALSQQFTYLINSAAHKWGTRQYDPSQTARDNPLISLFTYGEGYHNYHHTFAWDYRNGVKWYHYDPTKWFIKCCSWLRLTSNLRTCSAFRQEVARLDAQYHMALRLCERIPDLGTWRTLLEQEYQQVMDAMNRWAEMKRQWYQAKSRQISDRSHQLSRDLHDKIHDFDAAHIHEHYLALKRQVAERRKSWKALLDKFSNQPLAA